MQFYERLLDAFVIVGALSVFVLEPKNWMRWIYVFLTACVAWSHLQNESPRWQVFPLYIAAALVLTIQFAALGERDDARIARTGAAVALLCCLFSVTSSWALPMFYLPPPTGPYLVGTYSEIFIDRTRAEDGVSKPSPNHWREMPVRMWFPAPPQNGWRQARYAAYAELKPFSRYRAQIGTNSIDAYLYASYPLPVLIFGPRWAGSRVQDTFLAEDLASNGFLVIAIDHPYNAALAATSHGVIKSDRANAVSVGPDTTAAGLQALWAQELAIWVADDQAVLNELQARDRDAALGSSGFYRSHLMDLTRVGAFGHSFGGAASLALLGADPRIKCAINLDGWTFQGLDHRTSQPILMVYEGSAQPRKPQPGLAGELDRADNAIVDQSLARYGGLRAYIAGTQHLDFTDQTLYSPLQRLTHTGPIPGQRIRTITRGLVLGFFNQNLLGKPSIPTYPEVNLQIYPQSKQSN